MTERKYDLLLADVDGTLVTHDKVITPRAIQAASDLRAAGVLLAVTSGRPPRGMKMLVEPLKLDSIIAGFNGGLVVHPDMTPIEERTLPPEIARKAVAALVELGLDAWLYSGEDWIIHKADAPHVKREAFTVQYEAVIADPFPDAALDRALKIVGVSDDHALVERAEGELQKSLGDAASATRSQPYYLDITHPDANKGGVVDAITRLLGIPAERIATIGDGGNDVLMFRRSGFSIAMGNGSDYVQKSAKVVTSSNEQDGFAEAVQKYVLA